MTMKTKSKKSKIESSKEDSAIKSPVEFHKKVLAAQSGGVTAEDLLKVMSESTDVKEKILKEVVDKLFDKDNLLMISRLDTDLAYYIIKHLIIDGFYQQYFFSISYTVIIEPSNIQPFYKTRVEYVRPDVNKIIKPTYRKFINELLQVTISFKGQGRNELIKLYDAINERIRREDLQGSFLKNFGLNKGGV
jgi:hypothetical protein